MHSAASPVFIGDRLGRRNALTLSQFVIFGSCAALFLLFAGQRLSAWHIGAAAFFIGAAWTVDAPARVALVPDLLGSSLTADAMLLESFTHSILIAAGAYLAGWLLETVRHGWRPERPHPPYRP